MRNLLLFEEVKSLAIRDGLTGLYNYRYFNEMLTQQVGQSRRYGWPLSLLFLDLDDFKAVNDSLGHPAGDVVLKTVAEYLTRSVRQADILCRYGGEEFVVLLPQTSADQAALLAERLRAGIAGLKIPLPEGELAVTVSIGVAGLSAEGDGHELVKAADRALYRAKEEGKTGCVWGRRPLKTLEPTPRLPGGRGRWQMPGREGVMRPVAFPNQMTQHKESLCPPGG